MAIRLEGEVNFGKGWTEIHTANIRILDHLCQIQMRALIPEQLEQTHGLAGTAGGGGGCGAWHMLWMSLSSPLCDTLVAVP